MAATDLDTNPAPSGAASDALRFDAVRFVWPRRRRGERVFGLAVDGFAAARGEKIALLGPSGSGKSTVLSLIAGVAAPQSGVVRVLGQDLGALSGWRRDRFRAEHVGVIFQIFNLLAYADVLDNLLLPLAFAPARRARVGGDQEAEGRRLLAALGVAPELARAPVSALSVGQQQRVAAARALVGGPELVIADEPTSALDAERRDDFLNLLFAEAERSGATVILVTHDPAVAARFDRQVRLEEIASRIAEV